MDPLNPSEMDLLKGMEIESRVCRVCERPSGIYEECDRCFLDRLESQFTDLMGEQPDAEVAAAAAPLAAQNGAPPVAPVADAPAPPASVPPPTEASDRGWQRLLILGAIGCIAIGAAFAIFSDDPASISTAAPEPPVALTGPAPTDPAAAEVVGTWNGRVEIRYENGLKDHLAQTIEIARLNEDGPAGFSRSRQNGGTCEGPLTFLGASGDAYRFSYRELNTKECIASGTITLTPRGESQMDYREVTEASVNRGTLTRG